MFFLACRVNQPCLCLHRPYPIVVLSVLLVITQGGKKRLLLPCVQCSVRSVPPHGSCPGVRTLPACRSSHPRCHWQTRFPSTSKQWGPKSVSLSLYYAGTASSCVTAAGGWTVKQDYASVLSRTETTFQMGSFCCHIIACHCSLLHFVFLLELLLLFPFFIFWNNTKKNLQNKLPEELQLLVVLLIFYENFLLAYNL